MRTFLKTLVALVSLPLLVAGMASAQTAYKIAPGDVLQLEVLEDSSLNRSLLVLPDGNVSIPQGGTIRAGGHTVAEVQAAVVQTLAPNFAKPPTVYLAVGQLATRNAAGGSKATVAVYAMGEVTKPGRTDVEPGTTVLQFLAQSGGLTSFAATKRIQIRRTDAAGQKKLYIFNYDAVMSGGQAQDFTLEKGDVIIVPQRRLFE